MNILKIDKERRKSTVVLTANELVMLSNALWMKEQSSKAKDADKQLHSEIIIARDLTQYGLLDSFSLKNIMKRRKVENDESE